MKKLSIWLKNNKNNKKVVILLGASCFFFFLAFLLWQFIFSNYYIFSKQEKVFRDTVEKYYKYRENLLPKKGETRSITLEKLFLEDRIESLTVPNSKTLCDTDSWVKIYHNDNDEYEYYVYLKCGKYESNIDHNGPKIELNGENQVIINYGEPYQELGVKSVVDDVDGKIDVNQVEIDASKVNVNQVGKYQVTYKISDKLNNQTKVTRTVIVARNLTETVKQATDASNYYKGEVNNNYVLFSGMLFRIINVNSDGSVRIISEDITNNLRYTEESYQNSSIDKWLNQVFLKAISNDNYLITSDYCVGTITSIQDPSNACSLKIQSKVGLLSVDEYNKTVVNGMSSITYQNNTYFLLANKMDHQITLASNRRDIYGMDENDIPPIKPVLTLKSDIYITSGNGTKESPYKLEDYTYGKEHDKIQTRLIGEYLNYSGSIFRIIGFDKNKNVKVIMAEPLMNRTENVPLEISTFDLTDYSFNVKDENNPGYVMNQLYIDYLNENGLVSAEHNLVTNVKGTSYDKFKTEKIKTKLMLCSTVDLFSGLNSSLPNNSQQIQLFSDKTAGNTIIMLNVIDGMVYELPLHSYDSFSFRAVTYLNGNLKIKSGNGTINSPYVIK